MLNRAVDLNCGLTVSSIDKFEAGLSAKTLSRFCSSVEDKERKQKNKRNEKKEEEEEIEIGH